MKTGYVDGYVLTIPKKNLATLVLTDFKKVSDFEKDEFILNLLRKIRYWKTLRYLKKILQ